MPDQVPDDKKFAYTVYEPFSGDAKLCRVLVTAVSAKRVVLPMCAEWSFKSTHQGAAMKRIYFTPEAAIRARMDECSRRSVELKRRAEELDKKAQQFGEWLKQCPDIVDVC